MDIITYMGITPFTILHILGVALGLGIATGMDSLLMKNIFKQSTLTASQVDTIEFLSKMVSAALWVLWFSGLGFLAYYSVVTPEKLMNPKIWSKLTIVAVLTLNGFVIHYAVLPKLRKAVDKNLLSALPYKTLALFFSSGAISFVSWYFPFFYGTLPQLNFAFSLLEFSLVYASVLVFAILSGLTLLGFLYGRHSRQEKEKTHQLLNRLLNTEKSNHVLRPQHTNAQLRAVG